MYDPCLRGGVSRPPLLMRWLHACIHASTLSVPGLVVFMIYLFYFMFFLNSRRFVPSVGIRVGAAGHVLPEPLIFCGHSPYGMPRTFGMNNNRSFVQLDIVDNCNI